MTFPLGEIEMIERVARALSPVSWAALDNGSSKPGDHHQVYRDHSLVLATAALAAMREPTEAMIRQGIQHGTAENVWKAMIGTTLKSQSPETAGE
jgi:hypothetical protein